MLTIFQESVPFTNKRIESAVSQNTFLNPIIMPFALNSTQSDNIIETVFYIKNTDVSLFYKDIVVSLMKEDANVLSTDPSNGIIKSDKTVISINNSLNIPLSLAFDGGGGYTPSHLIGKYQANYVPVVSSDTDINVKFSYGYDQISDYRWEELKTILLIPYIGNSTTPDTSYIPIRMRITFKNPQNISIYTIRDYFLDVSFSDTGNVN